MSKQKLPIRNESQCVWSKINNDTFIISDEGAMFHQLNTVGEVIWNMCTGTCSIKEIADSLCNEFEIEKEAAVKDVVSFLEELSHKGLIHFKEGE
ncbi:MAG: PqqD family protein [Candidatus Brocadiaceae bacterium]|nr:PqqD family protein [Candidatus Brocadiaceae bacterium]